MEASLTRRAVEDQIEKLIDLLDALDPDPDLEETGDLEPSLGAYFGPYVDAELDTSDDEFSLGSLSCGNQTHWADGAAGDYEEQCEDEGGQCEDEGIMDPDLEPWLGAFERHEEGQRSSWDNNFSDREEEVRIFYQRPSPPDRYTRAFLEGKEERRIVECLENIVAKKARTSKRRKAHA